MAKYCYRYLKVFLLVLVAASMLTNCAKQEDDGDTAPTIPPLSTFKIDFDNFPKASSKPSSAPTKSEVTSRALALSNHDHAAAQVLVWQVLLTVGLAIPVASFAESFNHFPVRLSDGTWVWTYTVLAHTAELHGKKNGNQVDWEMYISKVGGFQDFNWYSGVSKLDGSEGSWTLRKSTDDPVDLLSIEWHRDVTNDTGDIKYTNIEPGGAENGGYIFYGKTTDTTYDAYYHIYNKGQDNLTEIEWNLTSKAGRIKDEKHYSDTDWHYWDENLDDIPAP